MDLQEAWKKLDHEKLTKPVSGEIEIRNASKHPVQKLIGSFRFVLGLVGAFEIGFVYLFFSMPQLIVKIFLMLMIVAYVFFFVINYRALQNIERHFVMDVNFKDSLQQIYENTQASLAFQRRAALYFYPFACTAGFVLGLSFEKDAIEAMQTWRAIIGLSISIIVLTPISYYLALWMDRACYGKYLGQLEGLIAELNQIEE